MNILTGIAADFGQALQSSGYSCLRRGDVTTLQINVGKVCNQACHHCHVDAGPKRTESMTGATAERVLAVLACSPGIRVVDITGGAPELNPNFRVLVQAARSSGRRVIDRCNLTILLEPGFESMPAFLAEQRVDVTASLPCYTAANVDKQRGRGVFEKSIRALRLLNNLGYGCSGSGLELNLVYNPIGSALPPAQTSLEQDYRRRLRADFGIVFNHLFTITNMPISRFADALTRSGETERYMRVLVEHFNRENVDGLMCRSLISVGWDGALYDCDFNQMLELPAPSRNGHGKRTIWNLESFDELSEQPIATGSHCFGCTAGPGSSCGGQLAKS